MKPAFLKFGLLTVIITLMSFNSDHLRLYEFKHPKKKKIVLSVKSDKLGEFVKEKRGKDYYYNNLGKADIHCSILFFKLNENDRKNLIELPKMLMDGPDRSPAYPLSYFSNYSKLKPFESNEAKWGELNDDFMYRHADIIEIQGQAINQKHMYAYSMIDNDMFINIHLSKTNCSASDSSAMRKILDGFIIKK